VSADVCFEANNEPKLNVTPSPRCARRESCGAPKRIFPVSVGEHLVDGHLGNPACRIPSCARDFTPWRRVPYGSVSCSTLVPILLYVSARWLVSRQFR
jgi:hypothetical protein